MTPQERKNFEWIRDNVSDKRLMEMPEDTAHRAGGLPMTKMLIDKETVELALGALENSEDQLAKPYSTDVRRAITALRQAIEQSTEQSTEQKPVAYQDTAEKCRLQTVTAKGTLLHTSPPQPQEPVAWLCKRNDGFFDVLSDQTCTKCFPVYTQPQEHLERLCRIMETFDLASGHAETMDDALDSLETELRDVLGHYREAFKNINTQRCPNCASLEAQNTELDAKLAELEQSIEQEPVVTKNEKGITLHIGWDDLPAGTKLYTQPQHRITGEKE